MKHIIVDIYKNLSIKIVNKNILHFSANYKHTETY